nr:hypothetical protein [Paracoccus saliphilus]
MSRLGKHEMSREAYEDWSRTLGRAEGEPTRSTAEQQLEPVFVASDLKPDIFFSKVDEDESLFCLPMERELVGAFDDPRAVPRVEALLFRKRGYSLPAELSAAARNQNLPPAAPKPKRRKGIATGIAIIDDGIGFLNARFRSDPATSRFLGVWLQSMPSRCTSISGGTAVRMGQVLNAEDVAHLTARAACTPEQVLYREIHSGLHNDPRAVKTIIQAATHGTHVLGPVAVLCRFFEQVMCSKGDEPWAQAGLLDVTQN